MFDGAELPAGTLLGAYRIVRCIGVGGMGTVYEAEHRELDKRVALKIPHFEAGATHAGRARFVQEGKTASRIRHPHVVDITDVGEIDDAAYLVMEYLEGESLAALIKRAGPLDARLLADILVPVASALHEAHNLGIVHRDLKPDNIFLTRSVHGNVHPKVLDFGISKLLGDLSPRLTNTNTILGTPSYLSPEQLESSYTATPKSDQYSMGVLLYEAATGQNPFAGCSSLVSMVNAVAKGLYRRPLEVNPKVDERLARIALRAMAVSPGSRFASMAALGAELLPLASVETRNAWTRSLTPNATTFPLARTLRSAPRLVRRRSWGWPAGAALLLLGAAGAAWRVTEPVAVVEAVETVQSVQARHALSAPRPAQDAREAGRTQPADVARGAVRVTPAAPEGAVTASAPVTADEPSRSEVASRAKRASSRPRDARSAAAKERRRARSEVGAAEPSARLERRARNAERGAERGTETRVEGAARARGSGPAAPLRETLKTDNLDPWAQ